MLRSVRVRSPTGFGHPSGPNTVIMVAPAGPAGADVRTGSWHRLLPTAQRRRRIQRCIRATSRRHLVGSCDQQRDRSRVLLDGTWHFRGRGRNRLAWRR
jgi:hypothetical protein